MTDIYAVILPELMQFQLPFFSGMRLKQSFDTFQLRTAHPRFYVISSQRPGSTSRTYIYHLLHLRVVAGIRLQFS